MVNGGASAGHFFLLKATLCHEGRSHQIVLFDLLHVVLQLILSKVQIRNVHLSLTIDGKVGALTNSAELTALEELHPIWLDYGQSIEEG